VGSGATFNYPFSAAFLSTSTLVVADRLSNRIRVVTTQGVVSTLLDSSGAAAAFNGPYGVAVNAAGTIVVMDTADHRLRRVTPAGVVSTLAGSNKVRIATGLGGFADGAGASAVFYSPQGLSLDRATGKLFVGDDSRIRIIDTSTGAVSTLAGSKTRGKIDGAAATATFASAYDIALDSKGGIIVADRLSHSLRRISRI